MSSALKICPQCGTEYELDQRFCPKDGSTLRMQGNAAGDLVGQIIADRYNVLRKLGEGGMGTVYLAEHVKMGRKSALKVMNPGMVNDADAISRFNREAANASKISHPNVCAVYDFGETSDGTIYLAMEFIEGPSLTKVIADAGALPPVRAADITRQTAEALAVAHDMGIVHRDLKPDNIMIAKNRDGSDLVKVVDFGIAKAANNEAQKVTKTGLVVGTPEYMSPEQLAGDKLDGRSDTYSLALVAFSMMTGKLPFPAETVQESMIMRLTDRPRQLGEMKPDVQWPAQVQAVMDKALERDLNLRYQTASEFGRDLYKTVTGGMRPSGATKAMTAFHAPVAAPAATAARVPAAAAAPASAGRVSGGATKPVPATRINPATPAQPTPAVSPKRRSPALMGIAAFVVVAAIGGTYFAMKGKTAVPTAASQQGDTGVKLNQPLATSPTPTINVARELDAVAEMPDTTTAEAQAALNRLQPLEGAAKLADDETLLRFRYYRSKAMINAGQDRAGCDSLRNLEGRLRASRFAKAAGPILTVCAQ
ncbi:MAG TPA: serine/threonine-protein kinase [Gemmatimonadaceae bacterium]|nr:serine/threonine-protein kinase [Gemmatimonadaceae bacterium]